MNRFRVLKRWESGLLVLLAIVVIAGTLKDSSLLGSYNLQTMALNNTVLALLAVGVAPVIITSDIDISIASMLALCGVVMARLWTGGMDIWLAAVIAISLGGVLGVINGMFVVLLELPALAVTLGTMGAYTGVAFLILKGQAITNFPSGLVALGSGNIHGTQIPTAAVVVLGLAAVLGFVVHFTSYGRSLFAVGSNRQAALFSGIPVVRTRMIAFVISGLFAGLAAVFYLGNYDTAQATIANDQLLPAITAVILGGVSAYGGTGTIPGVVIAVILLALLQGALGLAGVSGQAQTIAIGALLIIAIGAGTGIQAASRLRRPHRTALPDQQLTSG
ncbi:MAG TPA: ABC transporter permease [Solirubrobacteraceae bacterium]|jgi:rhamnose transport system permease protein|nr:ABC transporter permease [Solirubrobacteraceae bacterium]